MSKKTMENSITSFFHCWECVKTVPKGTSPRDWSQLEVGFTKAGIQVCRKRHDINVIHLDFNGAKMYIKEED